MDAVRGPSPSVATRNLAMANALPTWYNFAPGGWLYDNKYGK
jgi:hypothetical protein